MGLLLEWVEPKVMPTSGHQHHQSSFDRQHEEDRFVANSGQSKDLLHVNQYGCTCLPGQCMALSFC